MTDSTYSAGHRDGLEAAAKIADEAVVSCDKRLDALPTLTMQYIIEGRKVQAEEIAEAIRAIEQRRGGVR